MRVIYVKPTSDGKRFVIGVSDGYVKLRYSVSHPLYSSLEILVGDEIDDEMHEIIKDDDQRYRCMRDALSYLAYADNNRRTLYVKLIRHGYSRDMATDAVEECLRLGYINELEQLKRVIVKEADKLRGRAYIFKKLASKGYSASMINRALDELIDSGDVDFSANLQTLLYKNDCQSEEERKKLMHKYGYSIRDTYDD